MAMFRGMGNLTMSPLSWSRAAVAGLIFLVGCGNEVDRGFRSQGTAPPGSVAPAQAENLPRVAHPEYAGWSRFPVGTVVARKKEIASESETVRVTTTLRLIEKGADKVVVESQVTVDRPGHPRQQNPPLNVDFPATFPLPQGMQLEQFSLPSLKARQVGEEGRQACGREYQAQLFTWDEVNETGPMTVKLWRSDDIPGRMLRQEINGRDHISVEEVVEITLPDGDARRGA
jgi:hypothetical protein